MFSGLAGTLTVVPSQATASSPHTSDHGSRPGHSGPATRQNSSSKGRSPSRRRSPVSAVGAGTDQPAAASAPPSPDDSSRSTCRHGRWLYRHRPSTRYTPSRGGSARNRRRGTLSPAAASAASASARAAAVTSSASDAGTSHDTAPAPIPASARPRMDGQPPPMTP